MAGPVVIVGGGLAGLACARALQTRNVAWRLLESSDRIGGRLRT
ncbi:FAD-dependent oxidoreductase, partial [bacterium]